MNGKPAIRLFCSDLDGTLLGDAPAAQRFLGAWEALPESIRPFLVYSSGRTVADMRSLIEGRVLPPADYLIGSVGTEIHNVRAARAESAFTRLFERRWDARRIEAILGATPRVAPQPRARFHVHKSSWYARGASSKTIADIGRRLRDAGLDVQVIYSSRLYLDIIPRLAGKGRSLAWLCSKLGVPLGCTVVAGDSGNDADMFLLPGVKRMIVGNARPEILETVASLPVYRARAPFADGVLEGLAHYGVVCPARSGPASCCAASS